MIEDREPLAKENAMTPTTMIKAPNNFSAFESPAEMSP